MLGPVSTFVLAHVKKALADKSVVVWFDEEAAYGNLLAELQLPHCTIIPWTGSYYEMAYKAHQPFSALTKANRAQGQTLLLYVPRPETEATPLLEFAMAGEIVRLPLRVAAQKALWSSVPQGALEEMLSKQRPTLADLDRMGDNGQPSLLQAIFGTTNDTDLLLAYLMDEGIEQKIDDRGALSDLITASRGALGIPEGVLIDSHASLKGTLWRHSLISSIREGLTPQPVALINTPQPTPNQFERIKDVVTRLRRDAGAGYVAMAEQVAAETGVARWGIDPTKVQAYETFAFLEEAALSLVQRLITEEHDLDAAAKLVKRYRLSFWVQQREHRMVQWRATTLAVELVATAERVAEEIHAATSLTPADAVQRYSASALGWWWIDTAQRRFEALVAQMEEEYALPKLMQHARYRYERVLDEMTSRFADALERRGFQFDAIQDQTDIFATFVEPLLNKNVRVAYFLVDALRFEMGRELHDTLAGTTTKAITAAVATPPTITQVGMAALMPAAEKGISLAVSGGRLGVAFGETTVVGSGARRDWLNSKTGGGWAADLTLDELVSDTEKKIRTRLEKKMLAVVRSQEIDAMGEEDNRHAARQTMSMMLGALRKGIARVAKLGFTHVVIAADHGYLFGEEYGEDRKIEAPVGEQVELHRRCWIGRHATPPPQTMHFKASELGLGGDFELVVPRGLAIFKAKGGAQTYFHGGLSLQELVIPVVTAELTTPGKEKGGKSTDLALSTSKEKVTNRLFPLDVSFISVLEATKVVRILVLEKDHEVGGALGAAYGFNDQTQEITIETQKPNQVFVRLSGDLEGTGSVTVQAVDPRTALVLSQVTLPYELA